MNNQLLVQLPNIQPEEHAFVNQLTKHLNEEQLRLFISVYGSKRKTTETILICTVLGFVVIAGIQRFVLGQIGMGLLYLFTGGLCLVGTIVDLVNYKQMTFEYNQKMAQETMLMLS